jgi:cellulose biosynthesis protein BcsQ
MQPISRGFSEATVVATRVSLFNHKGGVSKTTTAFNLGWMMASKGHRVLLVDADPQCNLTGMILGYKGPTALEDFYRKEPGRNISAALAPAFESRPELIKGVDGLEVAGQPGLFLLPGNIRLAEYEVTLGIAQELSSSIQILQNLPGAMAYLLERSAELNNIDYILIDMSPSLSSINQNLLMTSHYFIVPTSPDYFSVMAIDSLASFLPNWGNWAKRAQSMPLLREASYPFPDVTPRLLGTVIQRYRPRRGAPAAAFQKWVDEVNEAVEERLVPALQPLHMVLSRAQYRMAGVRANLCLAQIADFNSLVALSQEKQTPVFALTEEQLGRQGIVLSQTLASRDELQKLIAGLADKVVALTQ